MTTSPTLVAQQSQTNGSAPPPVVLFLPGLSRSPANTAARIAELMAAKADRGPGKFTVRTVKSPGPGLTGGRRIVEARFGDKADVFMVDYRPRIALPRPGSGWKAAVKRMIFALWYFLRTFFLLRSAIARSKASRAKSLPAKVQLVLGIGAVCFLFLGFVLTVVAVLEALDLWKPVDAPGTFADAVALGATGVMTWLLVRARPAVRRGTAVLHQIIEYVQDQRHAGSAAEAVAEAVDTLVEQHPGREIHIVGYSLGCLVAIDFLYPRKLLHQNKDKRHQAITSLTTIGCPLDLVRLYQPEYVGGRDVRVRALPWTNVFIAADVLGSNLADRQDTDVAAEVGIAGARPTSIRYTDETLTWKNAWGRKGFLSHTGYWDEPDRENCLHLVTRQVWQSP